MVATTGYVSREAQMVADDLAMQRNAIDVHSASIAGHISGNVEVVITNPYPQGADRVVYQLREMYRNR